MEILGGVWSGNGMWFTAGGSGIVYEDEKSTRGAVRATVFPFRAVGGILRHDFFDPARCGCEMEAEPLRLYWPWRRRGRIVSGSALRSRYLLRFSETTSP